MRITFIAAAIVALACLAPACPPPPVPPAPDVADAAPTPPKDAAPAPPSDSGPPDDCARACAKLFALGCPEGRDANCAASCRHAQSTHLTELAPSCVASSSTPAGVRACAPAWKNACAPQP